MRDPDDIGKLLLRLMFGGLMLFHGVAKIRHGVGTIEEDVVASGLPGFFAYGVYIGEVLAPLAIMAGIFTRVFALVFTFNMLVAINMAHGGAIFSLAFHGGWAIELPALYAGGGAIIAILGPGSMVVRKGTGWQA